MDKRHQAVLEAFADFMVNRLISQYSWEYPPEDIFQENLSVETREFLSSIEAIIDRPYDGG